ncbi:MAG: hypothetical protein LAP85_10515 [Acidobacteriia bacterium]|nr:hypothetical protein [Terriglobia bacterium]
MRLRGLRRKIRNQVRALWLRITRLYAAPFARWRKAHEAKQIFRAAKAQVEFHRGLTLDAERQRAMNEQWLQRRYRDR